MRLIDRKGLERKGITYSDTHLERMMKAGRFPRPIKFHDHSKNHWDEDEIDELIAAKLAQRAKAECV
jgi:predicted DNA-binding transcriptional regulator AlpA